MLFHGLWCSGALTSPGSRWQRPNFGQPAVRNPTMGSELLPLWLCTPAVAGLHVWATAICPSILEGMGTMDMLWHQSAEIAVPFDAFSYGWILPKIIYGPNPPVAVPGGGLASCGGSQVCAFPCSKTQLFFVPSLIHRAARSLTLLNKCTKKVNYQPNSLAGIFAAL